MIEVAPTTARRTPTFTADRIDMTHGAGGKASHKLIEGLILPALMSLPSPRGGEGPGVRGAIAALSDAAMLEVGGLRIALTTDAFVVKPLAFPGGSIGDLAVNGTVNDLAVSGARPIGLSCALILEEGLDTAILRREIEAMSAAASRANVSIVTGDTKVVERGKADGMYIVTTGLGIADPRVSLSAANVRPGDRVICSGTIGDHGVAIMLARGNLDLEADLLSDTRALTPHVSALIEAAGPGLRFMRDPTRGGVATVLNELARDSGLAIEIREEDLPLREVVVGACEILGIDPLTVANEGKLLAVVSPDLAGAALNALRDVEGGEDAAIIGTIVEQPARMVLMHTRFGGTRMIDMLIGDPLPRIC